MVKRKKIRSSVKVDSYRGQVGASLDRLPPEIIFRILKFLNEDTNVCRDLPYGQSRHIDLNLRQICPTFYYLLQPFYWESVSLNKINMGTLPELFKQYRNLPKWIKHIQITSKARFDSFKQKEEFGQAFNRILMRASNLEACTLNDSSLVNLLNSQFQHLTHLQLETCRAQNLCLILNRFSVLKSLDFDTFVEGPVDIASGKQVSLTTTLPDSLISFATVTCSILKHFPKLLFNPEVKLETLQISTDFLKVQWWSLLFTQTNITKFCQFKILQVRQMRPDVPFEFPSEHLNSLALLSHNFILRLSTPYVFVQIEALANFVHQIKTLDEIIFDDCRILNPDTFYRVADGEPAVNPNSFDLYETVEVFRGYLGRILFALDRTVEEFSEFKVSMVSLLITWIYADMINVSSRSFLPSINLSKSGIKAYAKNHY